MENQYEGNPVKFDTIVKGFKNVVHERVQKAIADVISNHHDCKIGKSSDPIRRFNEHYKGEGYDNMIVVYKSSSKRFVEHYESVFNSYFFSNTTNINAGSGGQLSEDSTVHYVYVAVKKPKNFFEKLLGS
jgi:hypothetical protein